MKCAFPDILVKSDGIEQAIYQKFETIKSNKHNTCHALISYCNDGFQLLSYLKRSNFALSPFAGKSRRGNEKYQRRRASLHGKEGCKF